MAENIEEYMHEAMTMNAQFLFHNGDILFMLEIWAPSQYKDRLIYVWQFPC